MDPKATLKQLVVAMEDGDKAAAAELAENLEQWFDGNGFVPIASGQEFASVFAYLGDFLKKQS